MICVLGYIEEGGKMRNYSKIGKTKKDKKEKVEELSEKEPVIDEQPKPLTGIVNCKKLNVRKGPDKNSDVESILEEGTEIKIYNEVNDFYQIDNELYCMKEFIKIIDKA